MLAAKTGKDYINVNENGLTNFLSNFATATQNNFYNKLINYEIKTKKSESDDENDFNNTIIFMLALIKEIYYKAGFQHTCSLYAVKCILDLISKDIDEELAEIFITQDEINNVLTAFNKTNEDFFNSLTTLNLRRIVFVYIPKIIYTTMKFNSKIKKVKLDNINTSIIDYLDTDFSKNIEFKKDSVFYDVIGCDPSLLITKEFTKNQGGDYVYVSDNSDKLFNFLDKLSNASKYKVITGDTNVKVDEQIKNHNELYLGPTKNKRVKLKSKPTV